MDKETNDHSDCHRYSHCGCMYNTSDESSLSESACSLRSRLDLLLDQWKRRLRKAEKLLNDAAGAHEWNNVARLKGKVGMIRSMVVELERELRNS